MLNSNKRNRKVLGAVLALTLLAGCLAVSAFAADSAPAVDLKDLENATPVVKIQMSDGTVCEAQGTVGTFTVMDPEKATDGEIWYTVDGEQAPGAVVQYDLTGIDLDETGELNGVSFQILEGNAQISGVYSYEIVSD